MLPGPGGHMRCFPPNVWGRGRGTAEAIRPRLASLFEPPSPNTPAGDWEGETDAFEDARSETAPEPGIEASVPPPVNRVQHDDASRRISRASQSPRSQTEPAETAPETDLTDKPRPHDLDTSLQPHQAPHAREGTRHTATPAAARPASRPVQPTAATPKTIAPAASLFTYKKPATSALPDTLGETPATQTVVLAKAERRLLSPVPSVLDSQPLLTLPPRRPRFEPAAAPQRSAPAN